MKGLSCEAEWMREVGNCANGKENSSNNTDVLTDVLRETPRLIHRGLFLYFRMFVDDEEH